MKAVIKRTRFAACTVIPRALDVGRFRAGGRWAKRCRLSKARSQRPKPFTPNRRSRGSSSRHGTRHLTTKEPLPAGLTLKAVSGHQKPNGKSPALRKQRKPKRPSPRSEKQSRRSGREHRDGQTGPSTKRCRLSKARTQRPRPASRRTGDHAIVVKGTNLATLTAKELPAGLTLKAETVSETEWEDRQAHPQPPKPKTVTLEAKNAAKRPRAPRPFKWTVNERKRRRRSNRSPNRPAPPAPRSRPSSSRARASPNSRRQNSRAGLTLTKVGETEWTITGTPTTAGATTVTLEAKNAEGVAGPIVTFKWTVNAARRLQTSPKPPRNRWKHPRLRPPKSPAPAASARCPRRSRARQLFASFLCEVATCRVTIGALITAGTLEVPRPLRRGLDQAGQQGQDRRQAHQEAARADRRRAEEAQEGHRRDQRDDRKLRRRCS